MHIFLINVCVHQNFGNRLIRNEHSIHRSITQARPPRARHRSTCTHVRVFNFVRFPIERALERNSGLPIPRPGGPGKGFAELTFFRVVCTCAGQLCGYLPRAARARPTGCAYACMQLMIMHACVYMRILFIHNRPVYTYYVRTSRARARDVRTRAHLRIFIIINTYMRTSVVLKVTYVCTCVRTYTYVYT